MAEALRTSRLVTITGPGGTGKTRLALEVLRRRRHGREAAWLVDLVALPAGADVAAETARVLDIPAATGGAATAALTRYLGGRDALLVLDNCEHVIDACAELATALLGACPSLRVLTTSRESLAVEGEFVWTLDPLPADDARRLFVERARQRKPSFVPAPHDDVAIEQICARLDRLPLAIELAAARVRMMSPAEIVVALDRRYDALGGGRRGSPAHHRSVRATVEWSYDLLDAEEQRAFRALGVFAADFDARAAAAVATPCHPTCWPGWSTSRW